MVLLNVMRPLLNGPVADLMTKTIVGPRVPTLEAEVEQLGRSFASHVDRG